MGVRDAKREELSRLESKTLDAQFRTTICKGLSCSPFEAEAGRLRRGTVDRDGTQRVCPVKAADMAP